MRQSYKRELKALKADRRMKTIAGRLERELERNLAKEGLLGDFAEEIAL